MTDLAAKIARAREDLAMLVPDPRINETKSLRVRLRQVVHGDFPFGHETWAPPGLYNAVINSNGAVSIMAMNNTLLGLRPIEFEWACGCGGGVWDARQLRSCCCDFKPGEETPR